MLESVKVIKDEVRRIMECAWNGRKHTSSCGVYCEGSRSKCLKQMRKMVRLSK
jgi:hypothetical protein